MLFYIWSHSKEEKMSWSFKKKPGGVHGVSTLAYNIGNKIFFLGFPILPWGNNLLLLHDYGPRGKKNDEIRRLGFIFHLLQRKVWNPVR